MDKSIGNDRTTIPEDEGSSAPFPPGTVLGQYRILRFLGKGGMGVVYLAKHDTLKSFHALKVVLSQHSGAAGFAERFLAEARIMSKLRHPNIVHCTDAGIHEGTSYLVMDYIEGPHGETLDLAQLLRHRQEKGEPLDEDEAVSVGLQICEGLAYAHSYRDAEVPNGIVHRDLKPANILVGAETQLLITDFGLARLMGPDFENSVIQESMAHGLSLGEQQTVGEKSIGDASTKGNMSSSGLVGTFAYMSPEQRGSGEIDCRSDVYAMGVILYELLTGRQVVGQLKPPNAVRPDLNPAWDSLLLEGCLAYEKNERFESAEDLCRAIKNITAAPIPQPAATVTPSLHETAIAMPGYVKGGRLIRLMGWIQLIAAGGMTIAILIPMLNEGGKDIVPAFFVAAITIVIPVVQLIIGKAVKEHKSWGRVVGIILGILFLLGFPIGTIIGAFVLYYLIAGWDESEQVAQTQQ